MKGILQYVFFCIWLVSYSILFPRFIYVVACNSTMFFFITENCYSLYKFYSLIIYVFIYYSSADAYIGFHFLAIMNNSAMNIHA